MSSKGITENCEDLRAPTVMVAAPHPVPTARVSQVTMYSGMDDLRAKLADLRLRVETGDSTKAPWLSCQAIDPLSKNDIVVLSETLLQSRELIKTEKWVDFELISDCLLQRYLTFIVQGEITAAPCFSAMLWAARERYRSPKSGERFWRVPPSFMDAVL